jgi:IclR family transcriptional regulator, mhp operon transcriptional activator
MRGLDALAVLNLRGGATVSEVSQEIRLPRTTVYRILETLSGAGYVFRDKTDDRYRATAVVRGLADGYDEEAWAALQAKTVLRSLSQELGAPTAIATLSGASMLVRETAGAAESDGRPFATGYRVPVISSAAGRVYLTFCTDAQRENLLAVLSRGSREEDKLARNRGEVDVILAEAKAAGYATSVRARRASDEANLAIPIQLSERMLVALSVRFSGATVPVKTAVEKYLPTMREAAGKIIARVNVGDGDQA